MDTTGAELGIDTNVPRRLTRSMTTKVVTATTKTNVNENRRVTRSMTKHLRECNPNRTGKDADASRGQITRQIRSRTRSKNTNTRKRR